MTPGKIAVSSKRRDLASVNSPISPVGCTFSVVHLSSKDFIDLEKMKGLVARSLKLRHVNLGLYLDG